MDKPNYDLKLKYQDGIPVFSLAGEIGLNSTGNIRRFLDDNFLSIKENMVVVDFKKVISVDSVGISSLIYLAKVLRDKSGRLVLTRLNDQIKDVIQIIGVESWFEYSDSIEDSLKLLRNAKS